MARGLWAIALTLLLLVNAGCGLSRPRWFFPGSVGRQQSRAVAHDPYPDNEAGPDVQDVRPRDYARQLPEAVRSQPQYPGGNQGTWFTP